MLSDLAWRFTAPARSCDGSESRSRSIILASSNHVLLACTDPPRLVSSMVAIVRPEIRSNTTTTRACKSETACGSMSSRLQLVDDNVRFAHRTGGQSGAVRPDRADFAGIFSFAACYGCLAATNARLPECLACSDLFCNFQLFRPTIQPLPDRLFGKLVCRPFVLICQGSVLQFDDHFGIQVHQELATTVRPLPARRCILLWFAHVFCSSASLEP
jgi:hypothetical protein